MIIKNTDTIDLIFTEIYKSKNILTSPTSKSDKHFTFECVRRYLDISRHLNRRWPYTIRYLQSIYGDDILTNVFEQIDTTGSTYRNLNDAACGIFFNNIAKNSNIDFELLLYEDYRNGKTKPSAYTTKQPLEKFTLIPYDLDSIYTTLMFYGRAYAPTALYATLILEPGNTYRVTE
ncbi:hypothetical protein [Pseudomonas sp. PLMAX]|uniref:hypothetical protein n=1 Tax=Pseudomonas sp. PLMAX TaxID=2201998 RepID=UPI0038B927FA